MTTHHPSSIIHRNMTYPGTDLKFRITAVSTELDLERDAWSLLVVDPYGRRRRVEKDEFFQDSEGRWYFTVDRAVRGRYHARFDWAIPDDDFDEMVRNVRDMQPLADVGMCGPKRKPCCRCKHPVSYEMVWTASLDDGTYLADRDGNLIYTNEGARIQIKKRTTI